MIYGAITDISSAFAHAILRRPELPIDAIICAPSLANILPDATVYWEGYPYIQTPIPIRLNRLMQERQTMMGFMMQATQLLPHKGTDAAGKELYAAVESLAGRLESWRQTLPADLSYKSDVVPALFEFQYV